VLTITIVFHVAPQIGAMRDPKSAIEDALQPFLGDLALGIPAALTLATVAPGTMPTARKTNTGIAAVYDTLNLVRDFHRSLERVVHFVCGPALCRTILQRLGLHEPDGTAF
jgi:hypothetical protein